MQKFKRSEKVKSYKDLDYQGRNHKANLADFSTTIMQSDRATLTFTNKLQHSADIKIKSSFHNLCTYAPQNQFPFEPLINQLPFDLYPKEWQNLSISKRQKWQRLIQNNRERNLQRSQQRIRKQQNNTKYLTFSPVITPVTQIENRQNIFEWLFEEAKSRRKQQQQRRKEQELKQMNQFNRLQEHNKLKKLQRHSLLNQQKVDLQPLYKRLQKVIDQRRKRQKQAVENENTAYSFKPQINNNSKQLVTAKNMAENVVDRLMQQYRNKQNRKSELFQKYEYDLKRQLSFKPQINNHVAVHIAGGKRPEGIVHSFVPSINLQSNTIMRCRQGQTQTEKINRLHQENPDKWNKLYMIEAQAYSECVFNPQINQVSRNLKNYCPKQHVCPVKQQPRPSFRPTINEVSRSMTEMKRTKSLEIIKKKNHLRAQLYKKQNQYEELKECSFKPIVKDNKSQRAINNNFMNLQKVSGCKKYLQKVQKGLQKQRQKRILQEKVFDFEKRYDARRQRQLKTKMNSLQMNTIL